MHTNPTLYYPNGELSLHRTRIMGILNVTPDSFSDGGRYLDLEDAVDRAWQINDEGADILDVGAQSTRPGANDVGIDQEIMRLEPLLKTLNQENYPLPISLDTYHPEVLSYFLDQKWVQMANDIMGLRKQAMLDLILRHEIPVIAMHMYETPQTMQENYQYKDIIEDLLLYFQNISAQVQNNLVIDPGIGFGKSLDHNLTLIANLDAFGKLGVPVLLGASRKSFIEKAFGFKVEDRLESSLAVCAWAVQKKVALLRVHDVWQTKRVVSMIEALTPFEQQNQVQ